MKQFIISILSIFVFIVSGFAAETKTVNIPSEVILFKNVKVFNGTEEKLHDLDVLVVKNKIHKVAKNIPKTGTYEVDTATGVSKEVFPSMPGALHASSGYTIYRTGKDGQTQKNQVKVKVIDGGGRTLMPGLIDAHVHLNLQNLDNPAAIDGVSNMTWEEVGALAYEAAQEYLYSGFTTVRDLCGSHDGLRRHIEAGTLTGPRIYLSGTGRPRIRLILTRSLRRRCDPFGITTSAVISLSPGWTVSKSCLPTGLKWKVKI